jgi:hypothetical protein
VTDLLFASSGIEPEIVAAAEELLVLPDLTQSVATVGHLLAMKLLARDDRHRPADADDLAALRRSPTKPTGTRRGRRSCSSSSVGITEGGRQKPRLMRKWRDGAASNHPDRLDRSGEEVAHCARRTRRDHGADHGPSIASGRSATITDRVEC